MYSEILREYAVRTNARVVSNEEYIDALKKFCKPEDLIGITPTTGCAVFNRYLAEDNDKSLPPIGRNTFSKLVKETFGMQTKVLRTDGGNYANMFIMDED